jgi:hypothetical protein
VIRSGNEELTVAAAGRMVIVQIATIAPPSHGWDATLGITLDLDQCAALITELMEAARAAGTTSKTGETNG